MFGRFWLWTKTRKTQWNKCNTIKISKTMLSPYQDACFSSPWYDYVRQTRKRVTNWITSALSFYLDRSSGPTKALCFVHSPMKSLFTMNDFIATETSQFYWINKRKLQEKHHFEQIYAFFHAVCVRLSRPFLLIHYFLCVYGSYEFCKNQIFSTLLKLAHTGQQ